MTADSGPVRLGLLIVGAIVTLNGVVWALQGALLLPATFMKGPAWIAIGSVVATLGAFLLYLALRPPRATGPA